LNKPPDEKAKNEKKAAGESANESFANPLRVDNEFTDDRARWVWRSKYPPEATAEIKFEAIVLGCDLAVFVLATGICLGLAGQPAHIPMWWTTPDDAKAVSINIDFQLLTVFFAGCVGGATFSIKWLVHAAATGIWHMDRRYWRLLIPWLGGVYACAVLTLFDVGFIGGQVADKPRSIASAAAFAFLIGYFSDGVSGLLSNIAGAVFGTVERK
jgi:hypothetical protein